MDLKSAVASRKPFRHILWRPQDMFPGDGTYDLAKISVPEALSDDWVIADREVKLTESEFDDFAKQAKMRDYEVFRLKDLIFKEAGNCEKI